MTRPVLAFTLAALVVPALAPRPAAQDRDGARLYAERCADCHGADATGVAGPDLTRLWASGATDDRVFQTIRSGIPGSIMPPSTAPDEDLLALVAYLKSIGTAAPTGSAPGDAERGQQVFTSTCQRCHRVNQRGGGLGPNLSRIAETRSRAELLQAVRDPSAAVARSFRTVTLVTADGTRIRGIRKGEDAFSIQILDTRERLQGYSKADLREVIHEDDSLMPAYGTDRLNGADLDDVLRFLGTLRRPGVEPRAGRNR